MLYAIVSLCAIAATALSTAELHNSEEGIVEVNGVRGYWLEFMSNADQEAPKKLFIPLKSGEGEGDNGDRRRMMSGGDTLSSSDKQALLQRHNDYRSTNAKGETGNNQPSATNMQEEYWDETIAETSKSYAAQCYWGHDSNNNQYGENLYAGASSRNIENIDQLLGGVKGWYDEYQYYTWSSRTCDSGEQCGHYTQVVWDNSYELGCGYKMCDCGTLISGWASYPYCIYLVCRYYRPGNYVGQYAYETGTTASECPSGWSANTDTGLCYDPARGNGDGSGGGGSSPASSPTKRPTASNSSPTKRPTSRPTGAFSGYCSTCTVEFIHTYTLKPYDNYQTAWQTIWDLAGGEVRDAATRGYSYSGSYTYFWDSAASSYGFTVKMTATLYSNDDADNLVESVGSTAYKQECADSIDNEVNGVSVSVTKSDAADDGQAYSSGSGSNNNNNGNGSWWLWFIVIIACCSVGMVVGAFINTLYNQRKAGKEKNTSAQSYKQMTDVRY